MAAIEVDPGLAARPLPAGHRLHGILRAALGRRGSRPVGPGRARVPPWPAAHFRLDRVARFRRASPALRRRILAGCAEDLLAEAYAVEKLGLAFTAKMLLLSETTEERQLYALFAADEATHLAAIEPHVPPAARAGAPAEPFLALLAGAIAEGSRPTLIFLVQVVLEGWGLVHYQGLARGCRDPRLRRTLAGLLGDEALHHGSGLALSRPHPLAGADRDHAVLVMDRLAGLVRVGPGRVVARLEAATGPLTSRQRQVVLDELDAPTHVAERLALLSRLAAVQPTVAERLDCRRPVPRPSQARPGSWPDLPSESLAEPVPEPTPLQTPPLTQEEMP